MKKSLVVAVVVLLATLPFEAAAKSPVPKQSSAAVVSLPGGGKLIGDLYTNSEYKLELRIPQGFVLDASTADDDKRGAELMAGGNEQRKRALEAASALTTNLIDVARKEPGIYRSFSLMTEDIGSAPLIESGRDYINHVMTQLRASKMNFKESDGSNQNFDGRDFSTKALELRINGATIYQAYAATIVGRRSLVMILTSESSAGLHELMAAFKPHFLEPSPGQKRGPQTSEEQSSRSQIQNSVYTNSYFKMSFRLPDGWTLREGAREAVRQRAVENAQAAQSEKVGMEILFIATPPESTNSVMMMSIALNGSRITPAEANESVIVAAQKRGFQPVSKAEEKKISGQQFSRSVLKGFADGLDVYQAYNTAVLRDHVVCLVVTAHDTEQLDNLLTISMKSLDFD